MSRLVIGFSLGILAFCHCSKTTEQRADQFLKNGDKRNAYVLYQKAIKTGTEAPSKELRDKFLSLTVDMAKDRIRDEESLESLTYFRSDFTKYAQKDTDPQICYSYAGFLIQWADSAYEKFQDIHATLALLKDAKKYAPKMEAIPKREAQYRKKFGLEKLKQAEETYRIARKENRPLVMVEAEYYALHAKKYLPENKKIAGILKKTRKENLGTYAAYDRAFEDGKTDSEVDKYNIYMAITEQRRRGRGVRVKGTIYNLSPDGPLELKAKQFSLVDVKGKKHRAGRRSKFQKITVDVKIESKFTLEFPSIRKKPARLVYNDGKRQTEKWYP